MTENKAHYLGKTVKVYLSKESWEIQRQQCNWAYGIVRDVWFKPSKKSKFFINVFFKLEPVEEITGNPDLYREKKLVEWIGKPCIHHLEYDFKIERIVIDKRQLR